jgi:hypothetical protein
LGLCLLGAIALFLKNKTSLFSARSSGLRRSYL